MRIFKGPLPPSVLNRLSEVDASNDANGPTNQIEECLEQDAPQEGQPMERVKRKCGRPRNPIPRHKRDSHINAEHRRRGKIQDCFQTLKTMVPRYTVDSGRNSKSNVLSNAVDHCRFLEREVEGLNSDIENMKAELASLREDIETYSSTDEDNFEQDNQETSRLDDHFQCFVTSQANWTSNGIFLRIAGSLFNSYKQSVIGQSTNKAFALSVAKWAVNTFSTENLRKVCTAAVESDVDVEYQSTFLSQPALKAKYSIKPEDQPEKHFSSHTRHSISDAHTHRHHTDGRDACKSSDTRHPKESSSFSRDRKVLSSTSDSSNCILPTSVPIHNSLTSRRSRNDPDFSSICCTLGHCALQEMTCREFSSFTRRDAQNHCTSDVDVSSGRHARYLDRHGHKANSTEAFPTVSSNPDVVLHERNDHAESENAGFTAKRRNPIAIRRSYSASSENTFSGQISQKPYYKEDIYSTSPVSSRPQGKIVDGDFVYLHRPWASYSSSVRPDSANDLYNNAMLQSPQANNITSPESGPPSPQSTISYSCKIDSKPGFQQTNNVSPFVVVSEQEQSLDDLPSDFRNDENVKAVHSLLQLNQDPMSSGSYLAQLLKAPLPTQNAVQLVRICSRTDQAASRESKTHMNTNKLAGSFSISTQNADDLEPNVQSLNRNTHISKNFDSPQNCRFSRAPYDLLLEPANPLLPTSNSINIMADDPFIPHNEKYGIDHDTKNHCSDADCLSATCDLYRDAQGAIDMTFESLSNASGDRGKSLSSPCTTYSQCKDTCEYFQAGSPVCLSFCGTDSSGPTNVAPITNAHEPESYPASRSETQVAVQIKGPFPNNSLSSDNTVNTSYTTQLFNTNYEESRESVFLAQSDHCLTKLNNPILPCSRSESKPSSAPILKQRYLSQAVSKTAIGLKSPETVPANQMDASCLRSNLKRPFCQTDNTHYKWKMRRLVLSGH